MGILIRGWIMYIDIIHMIMLYLAISHSIKAKIQTARKENKIDKTDWYKIKEKE